MSTTKIKKGLGRGLNALFQDEEDNFETPAASSMRAPVASEQESHSSPSPAARMMVNVSQMAPGVFQPRQTFDEDALEQLAASIRQHGLLQPILVRKNPAQEGTYEIIAGERRWRAAQRAQMHEVPVIIATLDDSQAAEVALIENLQREDLNAVEEALGYKRLADEYGHTQEKLAQVIGKSRPHIANTMRLLQLPNAVLDHVRHGALSAGHARALITSKDPVAMAAEVIAKNLSVRQTEDLATDRIAGKTSKKDRENKIKITKDTDTLAIERDLENILGMKVTIDAKDNSSGILKVDYTNLDQLDDLLLRLARFPKKELVSG